MAIGAGVENPKDLTPLRPFLSSTNIFIVLDNAESVLDPRGRDARETYAVVEELSQFSNVCLCVTSRISIIPSTCKSVDVPTLSTEAAHDTFYSIYEHDERSDQVSNILEQLDFHPLSVTLFATVAHHNKWSTGRLTKEWGKQRTGVLRTQHDQSLAATVELSLASPMFQELGPDARELLGAVAFFPRGIDEDNLDWLFPNLPDRMNVFDTFCNLSLTYRSGRFVTMLAPLRDYLSPKDPKSFQLLCTTKDYYFSRLSVHINPDTPGFEETRWIVSEDVNTEHLLDVLTSTDPDSDDVWNACVNFIRHIYWHKPRPVVLGSKIEGLPDDHPSKPECLRTLSLLSANHVRRKQLLGQALKLWRERGDDHMVPETLLHLSEANRRLGLYEDGISQAKGALEFFERFHNILGQVQCLQSLAWLLRGCDQLDAAKEAAFSALDLSSGKGDQFQVSKCHRLLGDIYRSREDRGTAIDHYKTGLGIASHFSWHSEQFQCHYTLAGLFSDEGRFSDAHIHIEQAKSHVIDDPYNLGRVLTLHAQIFHSQGRLKEAKSEVFQATVVFERLGAVQDLENSRNLLQYIQEEMNNLVATDESGNEGELLKTVLLQTPINSLLLRSGR